jgi:predicted O-methyltransferase YrrM
MYSPPRLFSKYIKYYLSASNGKGHGVHSPFVFAFIRNVLKDDKKSSFQKIEAVRKKLLADESIIMVLDHGAGSAVIKSNERVVKKIAASSLKSKKIARLLSRMVEYFRPLNIIELGTSFGITTAYLGLTDINTPVYTIEGDPSIASIAFKNFTELGIHNISLRRGSFDEMFTPLLKEIKTAGLVFMDGNHRKEATLQYFGYCCNIPMNQLS